jgi:hypothetical protein
MNTVRKFFDFNDKRIFIVNLPGKKAFPMKRIAQTGTAIGPKQGAGVSSMRLLK